MGFDTWLRRDAVEPGKTKTLDRDTRTAWIDPLRGGRRPSSPGLQLIEQSVARTLCPEGHASRVDAVDAKGPAESYGRSLDVGLYAIDALGSNDQIMQRYAPPGGTNAADAKGYVMTLGLGADDGSDDGTEDRGRAAAGDDEENAPGEEPSRPRAGPQPSRPSSA